MLVMSADSRHQTCTAARWIGSKVILRSLVGSRLDEEYCQLDKGQQPQARVLQHLGQLLCQVGAKSFRVF
ncbi:hypothetical protein PR048_020878 [Dryococelus australis]|uniref:Uncharacterized protein n=1 Tax=Dryococelus australis TaxID=614101 RepID=A0ABQ9GWM4_9NEOP|nr:hypothetical protein PR048_020878 [Dryococelus australis]